MGRRVGCPFKRWEEAYVVLPDEWLGEHVRIRDKALAEIEKREEVWASSTLTNFAVALSLAESWGRIPGIDGPPEKWDFSRVPLHVIAWVNETVVGSFAECFNIPKGPSPRSPDGLKPNREDEGGSETPMPDRPGSSATNT